MIIRIALAGLLACVALGGCTGEQVDPSTSGDTSDQGDPGDQADWSSTAECPASACNGSRKAVEDDGAECFCDDACVDRGDCCRNILEICSIADTDGGACDTFAQHVRDSKLFKLSRLTPDAFEAACNANPRSPNLFPGLDEATIAARIEAYCEFDLAVRACLVCGFKTGSTLAEAYDTTCAPMFDPADRTRFEQTVLGR